MKEREVIGVCFVSVTRSVSLCFVIWQIMEHTGRCVAVSEPNASFVFAEKYRKFGDSTELRQLARDVIRWECRPYPSMQPPPLGYCLKFMRYCIVTFPMLRQHSRFVIILNSNFSTECYLIKFLSLQWLADIYHKYLWVIADWETLSKSLWNKSKSPQPRQ